MPRSVTALLLVGLGLLLTPGPVAAQMPVDAADRPGVATPTTIVPKGVVQIEGGVEFTRETSADDLDQTTIKLPELLLRVGVADPVELRIRADGLLYQVRDAARDRALGSDLVIGTKIRLFTHHGFIPETALLGELSFPTGSDPITSNGFDPRLDGLYQWLLRDDLSLLLNTGFAWPTQGKPGSRRIFEFDPRATVDWQVTRRIGAFIEYYGEINSRGVDDEHSIDGGVTLLLVARRLQLDLSAGGELNRSAPDWFVSLGLSMRFAAFTTPGAERSRAGILD